VHTPTGNRTQEIENFNNQVNTWNDLVRPQLASLRFTAQSDLYPYDEANLDVAVPVCVWLERC